MNIYLIGMMGSGKTTVGIKLSEKFSDIAIKNKFIPIVYLLVVFFLIPFLIIFLGR